MHTSLLPRFIPGRFGAILSSDCGFGRQGMSRIHAFYKMIAIVCGANIIRHELGLPQVEILAADPRFAWI